METLNNVERIDRPSKEVFREKYLRSGKPVIIRGMFEGLPIAEIRTLADAKAKIGSVPVEIGTNYQTSAVGVMKALYTGGKLDMKVFFSRSKTTVGAYLDRVAQNPESKELVLDSLAPPEIAALYERPFYFADAKYAAVMFLANRGNASDFHIDWTLVPGLLYQVFGRKRFSLIPPEQCQRMLPIDNMSNVRFNAFSSDEKMAFVKYCGGYDGVLEPGETLFIPELYWHHLEYLDTGMGVSFRQGKVHPHAHYIMSRIHRDQYVQSLLRKMVDPADAETNYKWIYDEIKAANEKRYSTARTKYREMRRVTMDICRRLYGDAYVQPWTWVDTSDLFETALCNKYRSKLGQVGLGLSRLGYMVANRL